MKAITNHQEFNKVIQQDKPVLLDFYADWCGPCQTLMPTIEKIAKEFDGQVEVRKINIDKNCLLYTSPSPRDATLSRMPSSA